MSATTAEPMNNGDVVMEEGESSSSPPSLIIPITSSAKSDDLFIEIFPEEMPETPSSTLLQVLQEEDAPLSTWADAALLYIQTKQHATDASAILQAACDRPGGTNDEKVRLYASSGIADLTLAQNTVARSGSDPREELQGKADNRFTQCSAIERLYPMAWIGQGMLNLTAGRLDQARFFFDTTLKECGRVLPALLGLAVAMFLENNYDGAQGMYAEAIRLYPAKSGASARVGFGLASYRLGQVDRAKAAFARALEMDPENVDAMVGAAVLDMSSLDETSTDFNSLMEKAIKMMSMANLLDHSNAMVQNHLANHYFWKWTPIPGTATVTQGSVVVTGSQPVPLEEGERIRIGADFETHVAEFGEDADEEGKTFRMKDPWKESTTEGLKIWKKDYDRVIALAKGAYNSTNVKDIQAESLFFLARVYHIRDDIKHAHEFYSKACELSPNLTPARFGLAQTFVAQEKFSDAVYHLQIVLGSSNTATDALALLGLLKVKDGKKTQEGLTHLRKAIDLDPLDPNLILLEALALQQHESSFSQALERYKKAVKLMERQGIRVPFDLYTNVGVLCHETKVYDESFSMYCKALDASEEDESLKIATLDNTGIEGGRIRDPENSIFTGYVDTSLEVKYTESETGTSAFVITKDDLSEDDLVVKVNDYIRVGDSFTSEVEEIKQEDGKLVLCVKEILKAEAKPEGESKAKEAEDASEEKDKENTARLFVLRENRRLDSPSAISIAFNLARLHETEGRTMAAIELHKAIIKRSPAYINSYLRLACISIDSGALKECAGWLKIAAEIAPGNPEVLTLIGNLHLSLCDWQPAQQVFDGLLTKKVRAVEAYAMLSLGNIYFANLSIPGRYAKHMNYAGDFYKRIIQKDMSNAYAANGLGTVLAEKAELFKAKEVFNRVREVSGDTIADAHLNLGHIYLAQKRHPEALQMYQGYLKKTEDGSAPITSKSRVDDKVDVLQYIAFAYFDWARQTELFNNSRAAPADERYKKAMEHLELALNENTSKSIVLTYNLCMTKLQAANCILLKTTRNIRRTAAEVEEALNWLQKSHDTVKEILAQKTAGVKVVMATSMLNDFLDHCEKNIESAKSHLESDKKQEEEANEMRELQRLAAESQRKQHEMELHLKKESEAKEQEERDRRARQRMQKVEDLRAGWEQEQAAAKAASEKKTKKNKLAPDAEEDGLFAEEEGEQPAAPSAANLFEDSDDDEPTTQEANEPAAEGKDEEKNEDKPAAPTTQQDLFGDSSEEESDEELVPSKAKRSAEEGDDDEDQPVKKRKVDETNDA